MGFRHLITKENKPGSCLENPKKGTVKNDLMTTSLHIQNLLSFLSKNELKTKSNMYLLS